MLHANRGASIVRRVIHLLSCLIPYRITWLFLAGDDRAWKVDTSRAQALVGPGLATSLYNTRQPFHRYLKSGPLTGFWGPGALTRNGALDHIRGVIV